MLITFFELPPSLSKPSYFNAEEHFDYSIVATGVKGDSSKVKFELFQQHGGDDITYNTPDCVNG